MLQGDTPHSSNMIRTAQLIRPCSLHLSIRASARRPRAFTVGVTAMSKQDKAAEIIRDAVDEKVCHIFKSMGVQSLAF